MQHPTTMPHLRPALLVLALCLAMLPACAGKKHPPVEECSRLDHTQDSRTVPQNLTGFAKKARPNTPLLSPGSQAERDARYNKLFFSPWNQSRGSVSTKDAYEEIDRLSSLRRRGANTGYAENLRPWTDERWNAMLFNAARGSYPSRAEKALTVRPTPMRSAPTHSPWFNHPTKPGQGFPFDIFQLTTLPAGTPILILHTSADGAWVYAETSLVCGWVPTQDTAIAGPDIRTRDQTGRYAAILRDNVTLRDASGHFLTLAGIGTILPVARSGAGGLSVLVPVRDTTGQAVLREVSLSPSEAAVKPLKLTPERVAQLGNVIMGQPYGWGGYLENRDCSLMLRDMFAPFGVWLARNSSQQGRAWSTTSLKGLSAPAKMSRILSDGRPFATLLWLPGHITLYVGEHNGEPAIFHDFWGVRTKGTGGVSGRFIIGCATVTSTQPGKELCDVTPDALLINRISRMTTIN